MSEHYTYDWIGRELVSGWGRNVEDLSSYIEELRLEDRSMCLLAAILRELIRQREDLHATSEGMITAIRFGAGDTYIPSMSALSSRARKVISWSGAQFLSELTAERLEGIRNCGAITLAEILEWKGGLTPSKESVD